MCVQLYFILIHHLIIIEMLILPGAATLDTLIIESIFAYLNESFNHALFQNLNIMKMLILPNTATLDIIIIDSIFAYRRHEILVGLLVALSRFSD